MEPYLDIFRTLYNPCIYNRAIFRTLAHLETQASSKSCRTCKNDQGHSQPWHSQSSLFKYFQGYLGMFREIDTYSVRLTA